MCIESGAQGGWAWRESRQVRDVCCVEHVRHLNVMCDLERNKYLWRFVGVHLRDVIFVALTHGLS